MSMKYCGYRLFIEKDFKNFEGLFSIKECYFNDKDEIVGISEESVSFGYLTVEDMKWLVDKIQQAIEIGPITYPDWHK